MIKLAALAVAAALAGGAREQGFEGHSERLEYRGFDDYQHFSADGS